MPCPQCSSPDQVHEHVLDAAIARPAGRTQARHHLPWLVLAIGVERDQPVIPHGRGHSPHPVLLIDVDEASPGPGPTSTTLGRRRLGPGRNRRRVRVSPRGCGRPPRTSSTPASTPARPPARPAPRTSPVSGVFGHGEPPRPRPGSSPGNSPASTRWWGSPRPAGPAPGQRQNPGGGPPGFGRPGRSATRRGSGGAARRRTPGRPARGSVPGCWDGGGPFLARQVIFLAPAPGRPCWGRSAASGEDQEQAATG
jgi:hypothetical protein